MALTEREEVAIKFLADSVLLPYQAAEFERLMGWTTEVEEQEEEEEKVDERARYPRF